MIRRRDMCAFPSIVLQNEYWQDQAPGLTICLLAIPAHGRPFARLCVTGLPLRQSSRDRPSHTARMHESAEGRVDVWPMAHGVWRMAYGV